MLFSLSYTIKKNISYDSDTDQSCEVFFVVLFFAIFFSGKNLKNLKKNLSRTYRKFKQLTFYEDKKGFNNQKVKCWLTFQ